ncbi:putative nucleoside [Phaeomoniella chlamydospora]|uniref:Putative nucleoside n=1 Tax=Phaeomoniella chlamydospora TaxID=158046 RepID=A0A0G2HIT4_PHACM|nr:putative nucleoside [Phaeomoniella chlamydospora]
MTSNEEASTTPPTEKSFDEIAKQSQAHTHAAPHDLLDAVEAGTVETDGPKYMRGLTGRLERLMGVEARGIERVPESARPEKTAFSDFVVARYTMGWWPSKLPVLLNMVIMLGYGLVDCLIAGQNLSAVAGGSMTVIVGTIIAAAISLVVALFGIKLFHIYERYAFIPQLLVLFILVGVAGPKFNAGSATSGPNDVAVADRVSFFFLCAFAPLAWSPAACDFFVYFPPTSSRWEVFGSTLLGLSVSSFFMVLLGVVLASGALVNTDWSDAYEVSAGALITETLKPLGTFGNFCAVVLSLGLIANNIPGTYSAALGFQLLGRGFRMVPRFIWVIVSVLIYTVCACAGRNHLFDIFEDFLALMGYWTIMWTTMTLEEELIFRRKVGYNWEDWNKPSLLPIGIAALVAFCIGWVGAVLCMWQVYFTGPIAKLVGDGIDLGFPVSAAWTGIYPGIGTIAITDVIILRGYIYEEAPVAYSCVNRLVFPRLIDNHKSYSGFVKSQIEPKASWFSVPH